MKQEHKSYQWVHLDDRSNVIEDITEAEENLNRLL
ncbi:hypothetical protein JOD24_000976 [Kroppenstedtia sanguinis]